MPQRDLPINQLISPVKVRMSKDVAKLRIGGRELEDLRQGSQISLPLWVAERLWEEGLAEPLGGMMDLSKLMQFVWRERRSPVELVELPEKFYYNASATLAKLRQTDAEAYKLFAQVFREIVSVRVKKVLEFAPQGLDPSLIKNMTEEERELYTRVRSVIEGWLVSVGVR